MSWKVLVTARAFWINGQKANDALEAAGCRVVRSPRAGPYSQEELAPILEGCDSIVASSDWFGDHLFAACPNLKHVSRCGVGTDSVDMASATRFGVVVTNTPGAMTEAVADYAFGLLLAAARKIPQGDRLMKSGGWDEYPGTLVVGKTLGLIGLGAIGRATAERSIGFRMRLLAYDPQLERSGALPENLRHVTFCSLDRLLAESDFVSVHAPSTPETRHLINAERLAMMKPSAYLINTARGALVDEPALIDALERGIIAGAATDVYGEEPLPAESPLRQAPNLVLTPHNAFNAVESVAQMSMASVTPILDLLNGKRPEFTCNPEVWSAPSLRMTELASAR
ncbi:MAG: phosphoglycerate dehydrogenase [Armatimonadetes bacterium]|nr:phosphoglycerate dehydrogenase [Armatimonadota bacterium]MDE2206424.1 phosphoglycerate dehydrogenase [Armatimonadota bacterium]